MKRIFVALLAMLTLLWSQTVIAAETFTDGTNSKVLYGQDAQRIVSLAPNCTEMLWFMGLGKRQVARTDYCNYPAEAAALPSIGGFADTSLEAIVAAKPDLVVAYQGNSLELISQLRQLKISVVALAEADSLDAIGAQMRELYRIAAAKGTSTPTALTTWQQDLARLTRQAEGSRPGVFFGYPNELTYTCGKGSFIDDLITRAGGSNVVTIEERWPSVSSEFIVRSAPQVLLVGTSCTGPKCDLNVERARIEKELKAQLPWSALPAVESNHIIVTEADEILRPGPRILKVLRTVAEQLAGWGS